MAFINLTKDDFLNIQDELDIAIEKSDKLFKKKGELQKAAYQYWSGRVSGLQAALYYLEEAYSIDRRNNK